MRFVLLVIWLLSMAAIASADVLDGPKQIQGPPQGKLLSREVYDLNGKKVGLEEYSDADTVEVKAKPKAKPRATMPTEYKQFGAYWYKSIDGGDWTYCAECNPSQGAAASGPIVQSPMPSAPVYMTPYDPLLYGMTGVERQQYRTSPPFGGGTAFGFGAGVRFGAGGGG